MSPYFLRRVFAPIIYSAKEYWSDIQKPTEKHRQEYRSAVQKKHRLTCVRLDKQHNNTCWICESRLPGLLRPSPILAGQKILYFVRKLPGALSSQRGDRGSTRIADTKQGYIQATTKSRETKCCSLDQIIYQSWSLAQNGKMQDTWPDWYQTMTRLHWGNGCQQVSCRFKPSDLDGCIGYSSLIIDISVTEWTTLKPMKEVGRRATDLSVQMPLSRDWHILLRSRRPRLVWLDILHVDFKADSNPKVHWAGTCFGGNQIGSAIYLSRHLHYYHIAFHGSKPRLARLIYYLGGVSTLRLKKIVR